MVSNDTVDTTSDPEGASPTISQALRDALRDAIQRESIRSVARGSGVPHPSLIRFLAEVRTLRLDMADKLAAYLGVEVRRLPRKRAKV